MNTKSNSFYTYTKNVYNELLQNSYNTKFQRAGIYGIWVQNRIVYIGKSKNMLYRIATHMACIDCGDSGKKYQILATARDIYHLSIEYSVLYYSKEKSELRIDNDIGELEGIYIRQYLPCLNTQIPKEENWHKYTINRITDVSDVDMMLRMIGLETLEEQRQRQLHSVKQVRLVVTNSLPLPQFLYSFTLGTKRC